MVLPSLILRLEHLAQPDAPPAPVADPQPPAAASTTAASAAAAPADLDGAQDSGLGRRIVDVAAPERLSTATPLSRWSAAVAAAHDACFVLDLNGVVISISIAAVELLGCGDVAVIGRHILEVINLVDLETGATHPEYAPRITPLVVLDGPGLGRSLMRVRHEDGTVVTLDTSAAPVHDVNGHLLGSVTFLAPIQSR
ncbi:MAG: PAS domain-containing protein [Frankiaceae bacterium]|nr:PAS domain-containing protein [Frankiaceae bacterium]MBV9871262.1 PAS domain-containing protein [Frankiaceae bacterium]